VPQIFIDGVHVGGSDELHALESAGKLDPMLAK
jgi:glutaredoxin 3